MSSNPETIETGPVEPALADGQTPVIGESDLRRASALMALTANPRSERLVQSTFALEAGMSVFLDVDVDAIAAGEERRHQVRAEATVLDDLDCACVVTLEVFDKETGKTEALMEVAEAQAVGP